MPLVKPSRTKRPALRGANIVVDGNSISTQGYATLGWPQSMRQMLAAQDYQTTVVSYAVSGQSTGDMIRDASAQIDPLLRSDRVSNILIVFEGTNDLYFYDLSTANRVALAKQNIRDYCRLRQSAGWFVVLITSSPRANGYPPGTTNPAQYEADMLALDAAIRADYREYADLLFNFRQHLPTFTASAPYTVADNVHPNEYGCGLIASRLAQFLIQNLR
jgi:lysophospholipase L1-like esterase